MMRSPSLVAGGLTWPEAPRWRDGWLWLSDVHSFRLVRLGEDGALETVAAVPGRPSGMGFMPDGRLLLATAVARDLQWVDQNGTLTLACDLKPFTQSYLNDMVVDACGRAWVGDTGFVFGSGEPERMGTLLVYDEAEGVRVAATDIRFPNGLAIPPDGKTLYLAETFGQCITAFDLGEDGTLSRRRRHAGLESSPDGLCLDTDGHLWVPLLFKGEFHRISPAGQVVERIRFPGQRAIACTLGGSDRRTLFLCVSSVDDTDPQRPVRDGAVHACRVEVAGAGLP